MLKKIEYGYGMVKALVILGVVPVAIYSHGFAPNLEMEFNHNIIEKIWDDMKKDEKKYSQDYREACGLDRDSSASESSGPNQPNEPDNSGNPN
jgi:hypothetical protein